MKKVGIALLIILLSLPCLTDTKTDKLHFKTLGYSIEPLEDQTNSTTYQSLMMFLPITNSFAPNVNVQIQPYDGTMKEYCELSFSQFKNYGFTLVSDTLITENTSVFEYTGTMQENEFHWYGKAVSKGSKVYLVTATALNSQWPDVSAKLISCVDSFELD